MASCHFWHHLSRERVQRDILGLCGSHGGRGRSALDDRDQDTRRQPFGVQWDVPVAFVVFKPTLNEAGDGIASAELVHANELCCKGVGLPADELIGKTFSELFPEESPKWTEAMYEAVTTGRRVQGSVFAREAQHWLRFFAAPTSTPGHVAFAFSIVDREVEEALSTRSTALTNDCILRISKVLNNDEDYEACMNHALEELSDIIHPDRLYVLETDGKTVSNTFEWCAQGISSEIDSLQGLGYDEYIGGWEKFLEHDTSVLIPDIEMLREDDPVDYRNLKRQGIERILNAPFYIKGRLAGYLGADNYELNDLINTRAVLESCSYFIGAKITNQRLVDRLDYLSNYDALTGAKNRNALLTAVEEPTWGTESVGVVFVDVNGLKKINDTQGHAAGDEVLRLVARQLSTEYGAGNVYREGGDEFVAILPGIGYDEFARRQEGLLARLAKEQRQVVSMGFEWCADPHGVAEAIRSADMRMYRAKAAYYCQLGLQ